MGAIVKGRGSIRAVLGPTNTGKTHLAMDRMLAHQSGMIGFPLRLLARENYDRVVRKVGPAKVALITGEEKIIPPNPQWWICTVEAMPLDRMVDFLAIDEIQLCADPDRGHVFTDRLLSARGRSETMFMGSDMIADLIRRLVPDAVIESRPRYSTLRHVGATKVTRLPRRSAIVAFSVNEVYEIAELIRSQRGGTAVVLGALSPRTRNAQVEMYQQGEVDYLVATDAIGMGLNMDVDHVAFARLRKFDGHRLRPLDAPEVGQIAGRAGRHVNDGTFGVTNNQPPIDDDIVEAVENHQYRPLTKLYWRNRRLDFRSPKALLNSLQREPPDEMLIRMRSGEDHAALAALARDAAILDRASTRDRVHLLWDVCQVPDFRQMSPDHHAELLGQLYRRLVDGDGRLPPDWLAGQLTRLDRVDGDIDTLTNRIAHIRTLSYIAHRNQWLADPLHWQDRTREIEDRLSDALHERLIHRFVDKRGAVLYRRGKDGDQPLLAGVRKGGEVVVEGHVIGRVEGFRFQPDSASNARESQALMAMAERVLRDYADQHVAQFEAEEDSHLTLEPDRTICWKGRAVARLYRGADVLQPEIRAQYGFVADSGCRARIDQRLKGWLDQHIARRLAPLLALRDAGFQGPARGLAYQLVEGLGTCPQQTALQQVNGLTPEDRKALGNLGVRFGRDYVYLGGLLKQGALRTRTALVSAWLDRTPAEAKYGPHIDLAGINAVPGPADDAWAMTGYVRAGPVAFRVDRYETVMADLRKRGRGGPFPIDLSLLETLGSSIPGESVGDILLGLGCVPARVKDGDADTGPLFRLKPVRGQDGRADRQKKQRTGRPTPGKTGRGAQAEPNRKGGKRAKTGAGGLKAARPESPFAALGVLLAPSGNRV